MGIVLMRKGQPNLVRKMPISEATLLKIAELLGIAKAKSDQFSDISSIYVHRSSPKRGTKRSRKRA